ncbi:MAG: carbon-nitrogen hydrolase family protein [Terrisporobacter sp.]|uniref:carbon-nitrogen hydrolase family protein n=1 Tax=Terrisporobacter sp. TaxID=1965305 RepID=UPI002FC675E2
MNKAKIGLIQMKVDEDKKSNLYKASKLITNIMLQNPDIVVLPEMFSCPYDNSYFPRYAEEEYEYTFNFLSNIAKENNIYLVAGSIPEEDNGKIYNTAYIFDRSGNKIAKHRKIHLFDIDIKNKQKFKESDTLTGGNNITIFDTEFGKIGLCICYDFRFPELTRLMVDKGAKAVIVPASFNMTTGPAHWDIMFKSRAIDNQIYTIGCSPARNYTSTYISYGHSIVVSPFGEIVCELDDKEGYITCEMDFDYLESIREELPLLAHRRKDIYAIIEK